MAVVGLAFLALRRPAGGSEETEAMRKGWFLHSAVLEPDRFEAEFVGRDRVSLALGDNIFYGHGFQPMLARAARKSDGATVWAGSAPDISTAQSSALFEAQTFADDPHQPVPFWLPSPGD
jgi:hypothetical protein